MSRAFLQEVEASVSKETLLKKFEDAITRADFEEYIIDFYSEVGHGDSSFFEPELDDQSELLADLDMKFEKFKKRFRPQFKDGLLVVWREVKAKKLDKSHVGVYWTWNKSMAYSYWGKGDRSIILQGLVDLKAIDIPATLACNLSIGQESWMTEDEIRLKKGAQVKLLSPSVEQVKAKIRNNYLPSKSFAIAEAIKIINRKLVETQAFLSKVEAAVKAQEADGIVTQRVHPKTGQKRWALVSRKKGKGGKRKVLRWFKGKPSKKTVTKEEKRVQWFKHKG